MILSFILRYSKYLRMKLFELHSVGNAINNAKVGGADFHCHCVSYRVNVTLFNVAVVRSVESCLKVRFITAKAQTFVTSTTRPTASASQTRLINGSDTNTTSTTWVRCAALLFLLRHDSEVWKTRTVHCR